MIGPLDGRKMNNEQLAFTNQQLATMLKAGLPLEGCLRQLASHMARGKLRRELERLEIQLAAGTPLRDALAERQLPELYRRMLLVGMHSNDLPGVLTLLADYYQKAHLTWTRLKGLMVYPMLLLIAALGLSILLTFLAMLLPGEAAAAFDFDSFTGRPMAESIPVVLWTPVIMLGLGLVAIVAGLTIPALRRRLRWILPGFREANLSQLAGAMHLLLRSGTPLPEALALVRSMESKSPAGQDLVDWEARIAEGQARLPAQGRVLPPLFFWLLKNSAEDLAEGFRQAAELYRTRASARADVLLYAALPVSILFIGGLIVSQFFPVLRLIVQSTLSAGGVLDQLGGP
jgi:type II secretory pathway component PulF